MVKRKRGRTAVFTRKQNQELRAALATLHDRFSSQKALGEELGILQQNVARLLNDKASGFAYATASAVVRLSGYDGVDAFFSAKGVGEVLAAERRAS